MATQTAQDYLATLRQHTQTLLDQARAMQQLPDNALLAQPQPNSWSAMHCLDHLNRYAEFYHPRIAHTLQHARPEHVPLFAHGWLGAFFIRGMQPDAEGKPKKGTASPTFKKMNPLLTAREIDRGTLTRFIQYQEEMLTFLAQAEAVNLNANRIGTTLGSWLTLRLGDILGFVIAHNRRHMAQAQRALLHALPADRQSTTA